ncbi:LysE family transporter [Gudongella sp. DL1XJH-153]|uniref:LysE family transporter n=1 Tax=Gudongella sp. DL1XJH-153 TaxID=3409804 RepID=UPI003BB644A5
MLKTDKKQDLIYNMIGSGFRFGMILQLAIGPIFLLILQTSITQGFSYAMLGVLGVTLVDAVFVLAAILGLGAIINRSASAKRLLGYLGPLVLIIFGLSTLMGSFGISFMPSFSLSAEGTSNIFMKTVILTVSSPLTIVFWAGVFSAKISEDKLSKRSLYLFGLGAVLSTLIFTTLVALVGDAVSAVVSINLQRILNAIVGIFLIGFALKTFLKQRQVDRSMKETDDIKTL